ncbi:hypothetical protein CR513_03167, partial [Mucuna pruriens]
MTYTKLLPQLLEQKLVEAMPLKPLSPPYPRSYDPNTRCDYHGGAVSHTTERCWRLKHKVEDLLDGILLGFQDQWPNVQNNPLPAHRAMVVNRVPIDWREPDGSTKAVAIQENLGRSGLSYTGPVKKKGPGQKTQGMQ